VALAAAALEHGQPERKSLLALMCVLLPQEHLLIISLVLRSFLIASKILILVH